MKTPSIYIEHSSTNDMLCGDGVFRSFYSACGSKDDTLVYRRVSAALKRLNTRRPGKAIRKDLIGDLRLKVVDADTTYYINKNGDILP
jgi:hypothetical protein